MPSTAGPASRSARGDAADAADAGGSAAAQAGGRPVHAGDLAGTYEHLIRLTLHRAWAAVDDPRAER